MMAILSMVRITRRPASNPSMQRMYLLRRFSRRELIQPTHLRTRMRAGNRVTALVVILLLLSVPYTVQSNSSGKIGSSVSGCTCHSNTQAISPTLSGLPWGAGGYTPGSTYSLIWDGGPHISGDGGFNLDASTGSWSNLGSQVQLLQGELTHSSDSLRSWSADWTAPASGTGDVTFNLAVLYANGNGQNSGDSWGTGTWTLPESSSSGGSPPVASNVTYVPTNPTKATGLGVSYDYSDADGDSEQGTQIKWWRDGLRISSIDDMTNVPNSWIARGQEWQVEVTPSDVNEDGDPVLLTPVTIGNTIPVARDLSLSPTDPLENDNLNLDYEYYDLDGNPQQNTEIYWYLDGGRIAELDGQTSVSSLWTRSGDAWQASVRPHDGTDYGDTAWTATIVIGSSNTQPSATAYITPSGNAFTSNSLQVIVGYSDPDGDPKVSTEIRWLRDGTQISSYNDMTIVPPEATSKNQQWVAEVRVFDGLMWSDWITTSAVTIQNTPPVVISITMLPEGDLYTSANLTVVWEQSDIDGDLESASQIRWWVNGNWVQDYDDMVTIPSTETVRDQHWSVQVLPGDGESLGSSMKTTSRTILNAPPSLPEITLGGDFGTIELGIPDALHDLIVQVSSIDPDQETVLFDYQWSRNGFHVPDLDGYSSVTSDRLEPGQTWEVTVFANDPWGLSSSASKTVVIANLPPDAKWSTLPDPAVPGSEFSLDASGAQDPDGHIVAWFWTVNGVSLSGESIDVILPGGVHTVVLTVVDNMGASDTHESELVLGPVSMVSDLTAILDGAKISLSWSGSSSEYRVYRSSSPITTVVGLTSLDSVPTWGDPVPLNMDPVGVTSGTQWSETAPVATTLYYAVTTTVEGMEIVWIVDGENMVSIDATSAAGAVDTDPTGSTKLLVIPISIIMVLLGAAAIAISITESRRRSP